MSKTLKVLLVVGVGLGAMSSPTIQAAASDGIQKVTGGKVSVSATDQASFDRLCPLMDAYFEVDGTGQVATRKAITTLAKAAATQTEDPAVAAFLSTVPVAVTGTKTAQTKAAKALVSRECSAHGAALTSR